ncbi:restriction endonuclease subunit S [Vibrio cincinnatiensis]|uniref:restriction endonuclease subunit S n=1 Tax=Vibrio cincinnatiensis TaxID=675 RepID=UPI001EE031F9|nr:restriction endonuclease subunit S [Vibrio cincinnatiensis]MCG3760719.1 restriction endonuclease subunit S [Vibrio cincinnatiensis]MCG3764031.1 restriction endonuclease subunit S [Vibrio cincinnatiensis]
MSCNWPEFTIDEIKAPTKGAIAMGPFGSRIKAENFVDSGVPVLKGGNLHGAYINDSDCDFLTEEKADELKSSVVYEGDIVITHRGTIGQVSIVSDESKYPRYVVSQSQLKISLDKTKVNPYYVNYYLRSRLGQHQLLSFASQVGVPAIAKASTSVKQIRVPCPPLTVQEKIVDFIRVIDRKHTNNSSVNQTLEEMAQAIFKSWFVDFDPVKAKMNGDQPEGMDAATASLFPEKLVESEFGLIPEGWEVKPLDKVAHFQNGLALQKFRPESEDDDFLPVLKIAQLRQGYCDGKEKARTDIKESCRVYDGDMIFSWSGTLMIDLWTGGNAALNQHLFKVTSEEYNLPLYFYWTKHHLAKFQQIAKDKAVTMGHIKRGHLSESLCVVPPKALRDKMDEILLPLINQGLNLRLQSNQLATLRDTLLPKLLSGEIELAEKQEN